MTSVAAAKGAVVTATVVATAGAVRRDPIGVVAGRGSGSATPAGLGVVTEAPIPWTTVGLVPPEPQGLRYLVAAWPAWNAGRQRVSTVLHAE